MDEAVRKEVRLYLSLAYEVSEKIAFETMDDDMVIRASEGV